MRSKSATTPPISSHGPPADHGHTLVLRFFGDDANFAPFRATTHEQIRHRNEVRWASIETPREVVREM